MVQSQPLPFFFSIQIGNIDRLEILIKNQIKYDQKLLITTVCLRLCNVVEMIVLVSFCNNIVDIQILCLVHSIQGLV